MVKLSGFFSVCHINNSVCAGPYKSVKKHIERVVAAGGDDVLLTCQSEGYPASPVLWQNSQRRPLKPNTTTVRTTEQLFKVTSQIRVSSSVENNYTCVFTNDGSSATFQLPGTVAFLFTLFCNWNVLSSIFHFASDLLRMHQNHAFFFKSNSIGLLPIITPSIYLSTI